MDSTDPILINPGGEPADAPNTSEGEEEQPPVIIEQGEHHAREGSSRTRTKSEVIRDLNSTSQDVSAMMQTLTADVVEKASREEWNAKRLELETSESIYKREYAEFLKFLDNTPEQLKTLKSQKGNMDAQAQQIRTILKGSRFAKAGEQVRKLESLAARVKDGKAGITADYLLVATSESLKHNLDDHTANYNNYVTAFSAIKVADLTTEETKKITDEKAEVDKVSKSIINFFNDEIEKKQKPPKLEGHTGTGGPTNTPGGSKSTVAPEPAPINRDQFEAWKKEQAKQLAEAKEQIKSLENKLARGNGMTRQDGDICYQINEEGTLADEQPAQSERALVTLKLDTVQLPYFNGDLTTWEAFRDMFEYLIDKSTKLTDTVKFHQLRSHLRGIAFDTIRGYQLTGTNYQAAWSDLKKRFDRKEDLVDEYIRKFLEIPAVTSRANFVNLRHIIDTTNQMLRALPNLGVEVTSWDPFVEFIVTTKMDEETRQEWKTKKGAHAKANIAQTLTWLEDRAIELQPSHSDRLSKMLKGENQSRRHHQPRRIFQVSEKKASSQTESEKQGKCLLCGGPHKLKDCVKFRGATAKARTEILKTLRLCFKCLLKHQFGSCGQRNCYHCGGPHNEMLCYKRENEGRQEQQQGKPNGAMNGQQKRSAKQEGSATKWEEEDWDKPGTSKN